MLTHVGQRFMNYEFGVQVSTVAGQLFAGFVDLALPGTLNGIRLRIGVGHHCMYSAHRLPHFQLGDTV